MAPTGACWYVLVQEGHEQRDCGDAYGPGERSKGGGGKVRDGAA